MPFDWKEYFHLARILCGDDPRTDFRGSESAMRSSVSRAYYAAFCYCRNYAETDLGYIPTRNHKDHGKLINYLSNTGYEIVATKLAELRFWRGKCDYDNEVKNLNVMVRKTIRDSGRILKSIHPASSGNVNQNN